MRSCAPSRSPRTWSTRPARATASTRGSSPGASEDGRSSPSVDKLFEVERVEVGAIHRPFAFTQVPGGKGLNVARAAHSLGAEVRATGILAGHAGRWLEEALEAEGVPGAFAWSDGETR